jgi:hypothetical protein
MAVFEGFSNIGKVPELRRRVIFTLTIIAIYRSPRRASTDR